MSKEETLKAIAQLQLAYKKDFNKEQLAYYVEKLKDLDTTALAIAVNKVVETSDFLPTIATIRKCYDSIIQTAIGKREPSPDEAWGLVMKAVINTTSYKKPKFENIAIQEAVDNLGWETIYRMLGTEQGIVRKHFCDFYVNAAKRKKEKIQNFKLIENAIGKSNVNLLTEKILANKTLNKPTTKKVKKSFKPECPKCHGTGFYLEGNTMIACDCNKKPTSQTETGIGKEIK